MPNKETYIPAKYGSLNFETKSETISYGTGLAESYICLCSIPYMRYPEGTTDLDTQMSGIKILKAC
jgi:hypothetical protein